MILAFDSYYFNNKAKTVCLLFENWEDATPHSILSEITEGVADYQPGEFYKRELPCILSLLNKVEFEIHAIIIDGYVTLTDTGKPGLGAHLHQALASKIPIIGVAKSGFHDNSKLVRELYRGESKNPLYITAAGMGADEAYNHIKKMDGPFRMPTLLKLLDKKTREALPE
ncbi:endonuclease V [Fulvivirga maritima]|uniref:endonuclease V n=1 Tax=Fulvivirga maritima TaxID=2904247 RepID=UPI001F2EC5DC|nr:endonuclease V [Fulvivirga maritima]UII24528.1 endonuclease V [Fulvivirga maritima]